MLAKVCICLPTEVHARFCSVRQGTPKMRFPSADGSRIGQLRRVKGRHLLALKPWRKNPTQALTQIID